MQNEPAPAPTEPNPYDMPIPEALKEQAMKCAAFGIPPWDPRNPFRELRNWAQAHAHKHHTGALKHGALVTHHAHAKKVEQHEIAKRQKEERRRLQKMRKRARR